MDFSFAEFYTFALTVLCMILTYRSGKSDKTTKK